MTLYLRAVPRAVHQLLPASCSVSQGPTLQAVRLKVLWQLLLLGSATLAGDSGAGGEEKLVCLSSLLPYSICMLEFFNVGTKKIDSTGNSETFRTGILGEG